MSKYGGPPAVLYSRAPIVEAVLDIRTRLPKDADLSVLELIRDEEYPLQGKPIQFDFQFTNGPSGPTASHGINFLGFSYQSPDKKNVFQARRDGFTHNRLAPYISWDSFSTEGRRLWDLYRNTVAPEVVELLGLTYINRLELPEGAQFEDFFKAYLIVPNDLPQQLSSYSWSFKVDAAESESLLQITQNLEQSLKEGSVTLLLSIQSFKMMDRPMSEVPEDEIWATFENLRRAKNRAFEACLTDRARKDFD